jgi:Domain of unknown function (DUF1737)
MSAQALDRYRICTSDKHAVLEQEVNKLIDEGWQPMGGVVVTRYEAARISYFRYTQTMFRPPESGFPKKQAS